MEQAAKFAESTQILMNVSEFTDVSRATDTLISAVQAFGYTAETSMEVVDLLNTIGNNYAISTADLASSLTKSSASLVAAGGDLAEAAALTATANAIIQDADSVGTALKTTSLRLRGTDAKILEEEGLDSDGAVTSKSKLRGRVKALSGVDILTESGEYKSTYEILSQIAKVWKDISDIDQAALLELISGKRNSSVIAAILQSPETLEAAYEDAQNSAGSALAENEKYLDSIQGKINQFNNALQTMWQNTLDSDAVKTFVDIGTWLVKFIDDLGAIKTLVTAIIGFTITKYTNGAGLGSILFGKSGSADSTIKTLEKLEQKYEAAKSAFGESGSEKDRQKMEEAEKTYNSYKELHKPTLDKVDEQNTLKENLDSLYQKREQMQQELATAKKDLTDMASQGLQQDVADYVGIDTTHIDQQIGEVELKLKEARKRLADAETKTIDNYARMGSKDPSKDKKEHEDQIRAEMNEYKKELYTLKSEKDIGISKGVNDYVENLRNEFDATNTEIDTTMSKIAQLDGELGRIGKIDKLKGKFKENIIPKQIDELVAKREQLRQELSNLATDAGIEVDTADIDAKIAEAQAKVDELTRKVEEAKALTEDDYAATGSEDPKADRNNRIQQSIQELETYKAKLNELMVERDKLIAQQVPDILPDGSEHQPEAVKQKIAELNAEIDRLQRELDETRAKLRVTGDEGVRAGSKLKGAFKGVGATFGNYLKGMFEAQAITTMLDLLGKAWDGLMGWIDGLQETPEEIMDEFDELNDELSRTKSELNSLESELENTNDRIEELMKQGTLSFVEQEELDRLQERSSELERQISLQDALTDAIQKSVNAQAVKAGGAFLNNTSFYSEKTKTERQQEAKASGETWGSAAGMAFGLAAGLLIPGAQPFALALMGVGGAIGGSVGGEVGSASAGSAYDSEITVMEAISTMQYDYNKLKSDQDAAFEAYTEVMNRENATAQERQDAENKYIDAVNNSAQWQANMGEAMQQIQALYNSIDWETATDVQKQQKIDWGLMLSKYAVTTGAKGSKNAAIDFLLDDNVGGKELRERIERAIKAAAESGEDFDIYELFADDDEEINGLDEDLRGMGLTLVDVKHKFLDAADAESEFAGAQFEDSIDQISTLIDKLQELKDAFTEWSDKGFVSTKTLKAIEESFGDREDVENEYLEYLRVATDPNATADQMKAATNALAEADIVSRIKEGLDDPMVYAQLISELEALGVKNAEDFVNALAKKHLAQTIAAKDLYYDDNGKLMQKQYGEDGKEIEPRETSLEEFLGPYASESDKDIVKQTILSQSMEAQAEELEIATNKYKQAARNAESAQADAEGITQEQIDAKKADRAELNGVGDLVFGDDEYALINKYGIVDSGKKEYGTSMSGAGSSVIYQYIDSKGTVHESTSPQDLVDIAVADMDSQIADLETKWQNKTTSEQELESAKTTLKTDFNIDVDSGNIEDGIQAKESEINNAIEQGQEYLNEMLDVEGLALDLNLIGGLGDVSRIFDEYTSSMETLASIQSEIANGFTISAQKAREFAAIYPEILHGATVAANGQITLNADVVNSFLSGKRAELNAVIDTEIEKLKAEKAKYEGRVQLAQWQLDLAEQVASGELEISAEEFAAQINNSNAMVAALEEAGVDTASANKATYAAMSGNTQEFDKIVAEVAQNNAENFDEAAWATAETMVKNMGTAQDAVRQFMLQCQEAARAVKGIETGKVQGSTVEKTDGSGTKVVDPSAFKFSITEFSGKDIQDPPQMKQIDLESFMGQLKTEIDVGTIEIKTIDGKIALLEAHKNRPIESFDPDSSGGSNQDEETAFELWQKQYEAKLDELEHKKEMLEGKIESLEAQEKGISNDYYSDLIDNEEDKMDLYEEELPYLKELLANTSTTSEEYHDIEKAIWDIEKAMQDSTIAAIKFGTAMVDNWTNAADKIKEAYDNFHSLADLQKESRENYAGLLEAQGHYTTKRIYDEKNAIIQGQRDVTQKQFNELYSIYEVLERGGDNPFDPTTEKDKWDAFQAAAEKGVIAVHQELAALKNQDIDWATEQEENINAWKDTLVEAFDGVREAYQNQHQYFENMLSMTDSYKSRLATWDINIPDSVIEEEIRVQTLFNDSKEEDYLEARREMIALEQQGIGIDDQRYIDAYNKVVTLEQEVYEGKTEVMAKEQEMLDNQLDRFNQVLDGMNHATSQLEKISGLMSDDDVATENGEWTGEGLARAGLAYQSMEYAKKNIEELNDEIAHYDELLAEGKISEKKHAEVTQDLTDQLWSEIDAMQSAEDSIIDLAEARIDMIEEGLNKEIDAYEELINLKKEELEAERDLFEFRRDVEDQSKNIAEIERRMASLSSSSSNEDRAEYKRLEKELYDANRGLADTYRNHAYDQTSQALDDELESYQTNTEKYLEDLRESIKNTDELIKTTYEDVVVGSQIVLETIVQQTDMYGITIDENLLTPWKNATQETINFQGAVEGHMAGINSYVNTSSGELYGFLKAPWEDMVREEDGKPLYTYSEYAKKSIELVKQKAVDEEKNLHDGLYNGFLDSDGVVGLYQTGASNAIQAVINKSIEAKNAIGEAHTALNGFLDAQSNYNPGATGGGGDKTSTYTYTSPKNVETKSTLKLSGKNATTYNLPSDYRKIEDNFETIDGEVYYKHTNSGYYYKKTAIKSSTNARGNKTYYIPAGSDKYAVNRYAKGTLGTKKDQFAITDEYGPELTLIPGKDGNLSFMRAGTGVVPADLTKRIMEIAQMPVNELGNNIVKAFIPNIETTNQSIQVNFEALVKADNITNDVLPEVEKLVAKQLNTFTKNLNYSLKKVGGR